MTKKNAAKEIHESETARGEGFLNSSTGAELFIDKKTMEIIDAQCEDKNIGRDRFLAAAVRLYLDFNYMAHMVGKDIFAFRDDMIKAIIKSKGDDAGEKNGAANFESEKAPDNGKGEVAAAGAELFKEIAELKKMVLELKEIVVSREAEANRFDGADAGRHGNEKHQNSQHDDARHSKKQHTAPISVEKIAMEFKDSNPPTYKDKRKKLDKLKF